MLKLSIPLGDTPEASPQSLLDVSDHMDDISKLSAFVHSQHWTYEIVKIIQDQTQIFPQYFLWAEDDK